MKLLRSFFILVLVFSNLYVFSANEVYADFKLDENVVYNDTLSYDGEEHAVTIHWKTSIEYVVTDLEFYQFNFLHRRVRLLSDKSIEDNNKVYLSLSPGEELLGFEARVILPSGKAIALGENAIQEGVHEESGRTVTYFAFEGIEKGSEIEYFYKTKSIAKINGARITLQRSNLSYDVNFEVICPDHLIFGFKTFNGLPEEIELDTSFTDKNRWLVHMPKIEGFKSQETSFRLANMKYLVYKLQQNRYAGTKAMVSYGPMSENIYSNLTRIELKSEKKIISKLAKEIDAQDGSVEEKVRKIENYLKKNFAFVESHQAQFENLSSIVKSKAYNLVGSVKLTSQLLIYYGINFQFVVTCDRTNSPFQLDFEAANYLDKFFFYFPEIGLYMDSSDPYLRLGYIGAEYMNTYGLFIKKVEVGDYSTGVGKIKNIKALTADNNASNIYLDASINDDFEGVYKIKYESKGYYAYGVQSVIDYVKDEEDKQKLIKSHIEYIDQEGDIEDVTTENLGGEFFAQKPLIVKATLKSDKFIEFAGNKKLFKLGELIGPQMELYQVDERLLPIQSRYNRTYYRELTFNIPEGYKITNLEEAQFNDVFQKDGEVYMQFVTNITTTGNKVKIVIDEFYNKIDLPKEDFEPYQLVVNAAANFNKVILIFEEL